MCFAVASEYFSNLDMSGRRMDHDQRAELCRGSVDFVVPKDYWVQSDSSDPDTIPRVPAPINYIFAIDVTWSSVRSGMLAEVIAGIKEVLYGTEEDGAEDEKVNGADENGTETIAMPKSIPKGAKIAIMTFDRTLHFYNLKVRVSFCVGGHAADPEFAQAGLEQAQMLVVPDLDDMFVPMSEGLLVDPYESRSLIEGLLNALPNMFGETQLVEAALGGPVGASLLALVRPLAPAALQPCRTEATSASETIRRSGQRLLDLPAYYWSGGSEGERRPKAVGHRQRADAVRTGRSLVPDNGGGVRAGGHRHKSFPLPFAVY